MKVESHVYLPQGPLLEYCNKKGIHLTAYCREPSIPFSLRASSG